MLAVNSGLFFQEHYAFIQLCALVVLLIKVANYQQCSIFVNLLSASSCVFIGVLINIGNIGHTRLTSLRDGCQNLLIISHGQSSCREVTLKVPGQLCSGLSPYILDPLSRDLNQASKNILSPHLIHSFWFCSQEE